MTFKPPTYEEYKKATVYARFRYKWSLVFIITAWLLIFILAFYIINYKEELTKNPLTYAAGKYKLNCYCFDPYKNVYYFNNETIKVSPSLVP